jgi:hypothetical protein
MSAPLYRWVGGIDEAGYGPQLGPLVVSATLFELSAPSDPDGRAIWKPLRRHVVRPGRANPPGARARRSRRIEVGDSKLVYSVARGPRELERAALSLLK